MIKGIAVTFNTQVDGTVDELNDATQTTTPITIENVLIAPITEPANAREAQALEQSRDQVRVHLPKADERSVADSTFEWGGKTFRVDSSSVPFMNENTPGDWNRYFRAECING